MINEKYTAQSKVSATEDRIQQVLESLKQFGKKYQRLPCPADPTLTLGDPNYGVEIFDTIDTCTSGNTGMLPVATLNLHPNMAFDAWGRRLKYVVIGDYVEATIGLTTVSADTINIKNLAGTDYNPSGIAENRIVLLVISHGENGFGAYLGRGGDPTFTNGSTTEELENSQNDETGDFYTSPPVAGFDDITGFWTYDDIKSDLME